MEALILKFREIALKPKLQDFDEVRLYSLLIALSYKPYSKQLDDFLEEAARLDKHFVGLCAAQIQRAMIPTDIATHVVMQK